MPNSFPAFLAAGVASYAGYFWPVWVIFGIGIAVVVQAWKAYGPSNRITEADVQREMERR